MTLQALEGREVPAGNITANLSPTGLLTITGDDAANGIVITVTGAGATLDPDAANSIDSGALDALKFFPGTVKSIRADFKGGSDTVSIDPTLPFQVSGAVTFMLGDGNNTLDLTTNEIITLGALTVKGADGDDDVTIQGGIGLESKSRVNGPALFSFASGGGSTTLGDVDFGATLTYVAGDAIGNPNDFAATTVQIAKMAKLNLGNSFPGIASFADCTIGGLIVRGQSVGAVLTGTTVNGIVTMTAAYDAALIVDTAIITGNVLLKAPGVTLDASGDGTSFGGNLTEIGSASTSTMFQTTSLSEVKGNITIKGGWYNDDLTANSQFKAFKNVNLNLAGGDNTVNLGDVDETTSIVGALNIRSGAGSDAILLTRVSVSGAVSILTFAGNDLLSIETASSFASTFTVDMGTGDDTISIAQDQTGELGEVVLGGAVKIKAGLGDDTLLLGLVGDADSRVRFFAPINSIDGGLGVDTFNVLASQIVGVAVNPIGWNP